QTLFKMARNSEKAQSMLYRFRESQAVELGLQNRVKGERRPRMASSVTSLRQCEMWRADILKEVSRKVSKIQDSTLTDYQVRDLNDEINNLMREKRHWETQIVALGGANYKRGQQAMVDDAGKEVPGTRGYKYFGRAKDLPGVKELFTRGTALASEESARTASFQMFRNQGPAYFGDLDEMDEGLLLDEDTAARKDWEKAVAHTASLLSIPETTDLVPYPGPSKPPPIITTESTGATAEPSVTDGEEAPTSDTPVDPVTSTQLAMAANFLNVLDPESLKAPVLPTVEEMGNVLLEVRKKALRDEYGV
ncbi:hypothetical protein TREMEDRAFT_24766, partial [Tremella mesenterica DSM 1558]|uniref:uncharacterized protein n=1 Tax=Tremella mesenterica (strain ATCC 24925 / CBS 8224 / DSM 1558 / NBRC 9311 / NRRL Y-6157 / RJB 2259-6 / UBC 559-6) TaxID=578456 RepID=UPI0003F48E86